MSSDRALTFCLNGFPGAHRALAALAATTGLSRHLSIAGASADGAEIGFLRGYIGESRPRLAIFGGWSAAYAPLVEAAARNGSRVAVYWTSSGGQTDMSREVGKLVEILEHPGVELLLVAGADLARGLPAAAGAMHLPVTLDLRRVRARPAPIRRRARVSFFFPWREARRKNVFNGLLAAASLGDRIELVLNGLSEDADYRGLLRALRIPHRELGWMPESAYRRALSGVDIGLQPSFAETFDYVAAEHIARGRPVVGSVMVPVIGALPPQLRRHLTVRNPDSATEIASRLERLVDDSALRARLGAAAARALGESNRRNVAAAARLLERLLRRPPAAPPPLLASSARPRLSRKRT